jgi:hypothetical protein
MFTLGTSAVQYIASQAAAAAYAEQFENALVAYVGTIAERSGGADGQGKVWPPTAIIPRSVFFLLAADPSDPSGFTPAATQTSILVTVPTGTNPDFPTDWLQLGALDPVFFQQVLRPIGGYANVVLQVPRGNRADMEQVPHLDGIPFYSRDTYELYMYDSYSSQFVNLTNPAANHFFQTGMMVIYPEQIAQAPQDWLRCDGREVPKASYRTLFQVVEDPSNIGNSLFGMSSSPDVFVLPKMSNTIIRT